MKGSGHCPNERGNARLKKAVADLTLDKQILKESAEGKY
jgi:hypothetical protein